MLIENEVRYHHIQISNINLNIDIDLEIVESIIEMWISILISKRSFEVNNRDPHLDIESIIEVNNPAVGVFNTFLGN